MNNQVNKYFLDIMTTSSIAIKSNNNIPFYVVYFYYDNDNNIIYIGSSKNYPDRHSFHCVQDEYMKEVSRIRFIHYGFDIDMKIAEFYYIGLYHPKYNKVGNSEEIWEPEESALEITDYCQNTSLDFTVNINDFETFIWGIQLSKNIRYKKQSKPKIRCIETGKIYNTSREAANDIGAKKTNGIVATCKGKQKTSGGYHWEYIDE